jgi:hypothetical protein
VTLCCQRASYESYAVVYCWSTCGLYCCIHHGTAVYCTLWKIKIDSRSCRQEQGVMSDGRAFVRWFLLNESGGKCEAVRGSECQGSPGQFLYTAVKPFTDQSPPLKGTKHEDVEQWLEGFLKPSQNGHKQFVKILCANEILSMLWAKASVCLCCAFFW